MKAVFRDLRIAVLKNRNRIQDDLDRVEMGKWKLISKPHSAGINAKFCLQLSRKNQGIYKIESNGLRTIMKKDLGVLVDERLKKSQECEMEAKKVVLILGCINRSVVSRWN